MFVCHCSSKILVKKWSNADEEVFLTQFQPDTSSTLGTPTAVLGNTPTPGAHSPISIYGFSTHPHTLPVAPFCSESHQSPKMRTSWDFGLWRNFGSPGIIKGNFLPKRQKDIPPNFHTFFKLFCEDYQKFTKAQKLNCRIWKFSLYHAQKTKAPFSSLSCLGAESKASPKFYFHRVIFVHLLPIVASPFCVRNLPAVLPLAQNSGYTSLPAGLLRLGRPSPHTPHLAAT